MSRSSLDSSVALRVSWCTPMSRCTILLMSSSVSRSVSLCIRGEGGVVRVPVCCGSKCCAAVCCGGVCCRVIQCTAVCCSVSRRRVLHCMHACNWYSDSDHFLSAPSPPSSSPPPFLPSAKELQHRQATGSKTKEPVHETRAHRTRK